MLKFGAAHVVYAHGSAYTRWIAQNINAGRGLSVPLEDINAAKLCVTYQKRAKDIAMVERECACGYL